MSKKANIIWTLICFFSSLFIFSKIQELFKINSNYAFQGVRTFYEEPNNSLDAVIIGGSNVHAFWEPPLAWADYGMAVYSFSVDSLRAPAVTFLMDEVRKTQPKTLFIFNLSTLKNTAVPDTEVHRTTNYMPFSINKLKTINYMANYGGFKGLDQLEFYFPIIRFHSSWSQLSHWKFTKQTDGTKHGLQFASYLNKSTDQSKSYDITDEEAEISEEQNFFLSKILDYCDKYQLNVLFINSPQALGKNYPFYKQINRMQKIVQERGYPYLDMHKATEEMGLQPATDFYNNKHTNVHGAIKYTYYLAQYLKANYGFTDKRGLPGWESWDNAGKIYDGIIDPYTLPFEREHAPRDYELPAPKLNKIGVDNQTLTLTWKASKGAEGYDIYRKSTLENDTDWKYLASSEADTLEYIDNNLQPETKYTYTVVPKKGAEGTELYGNFNFNGIAGTTK